jgi:hypothetical protein
MEDRNVANGHPSFWFAAILVVLLLAIYTICSTQITQFNANDLGLLTKLPITYWIGLSFLGILLYLGRKSRLRIVVVAVLISFYLFGVPVLMSENKALFFGGLSSYFSYRATQLFSLGHVPFGAIDPMSPFNWPGFFILFGFISASTGFPLTLFVDYFPLLEIAFLGVLAYKTLRLQLSPISSSFGALWFVASFWTAQFYFSPQGIAYLLFFAIFLLLAKLFFSKKQNMILLFVALIMFTGLVTTHLLDSFAISLGVIIVYVLSKLFPQKGKIIVFSSLATCILLVTIFFAYQSLVVTQSFHGLAELLYSQFSQGETHLVVVSQGRAITSLGLLLTKLSSYSITIINVVIATVAILSTVLGKLLHKKEDVKNEFFWIAWIITAGIIGVSIFYGGEAINRAFIIMLLPSCYFVAKFFSKKPRILIFVLIVIVFLNIPALYGTINYGYTTSSELKGGAFFTKYAPSDTTFFYEPVGFLGPGISGTQLSFSEFAAQSIPSSEIFNWIIGMSDLIISSDQQKNMYQFFYGVNLLENLSLTNHLGQVYDNGGFQIYAR